MAFLCTQEALANGAGDGSGDSAADEVARLQAEAAMPIEELMHMAYGVLPATQGGRSRSGSDLDSEDEMDDSGMDGEDEGGNTETGTRVRGDRSRNLSLASERTAAASPSHTMARASRGTRRSPGKARSPDEDKRTARSPGETNGSHGDELVRDTAASSRARGQRAGSNRSNIGETSASPPANPSLHEERLGTDSDGSEGREASEEVGSSAILDREPLPRRRAASVATRSTTAVPSTDIKGQNMETLLCRDDAAAGRRGSGSGGSGSGFDAIGLGEKEEQEQENIEEDVRDGVQEEPGVSDPGDDEFVFKEEPDDETTLEAEVRFANVDGSQVRCDAFACFTA